MEATPVCFLIVMTLLVLSLPRGYAIAPLLMTSVLMTIGPEIVIGPAKFTVMRLVVLAALVRVGTRGEGRDLVKGPIDRAIFWWALVTVIMWLIPLPRHPNAVMPIRTLGDQVMMSGRFVIDIVGMYYVSRCLIRNIDDIKFANKVLILLALFLGTFMTIEKLTGRNLLAFLGAVPEFTVVRDGKFRCQGSFTHPIHAGTFGSTLVPFCLGMWLYGSGRPKLALLGIVASTLVMIESASSGPLISWVSGTLAITLWVVKARMQLVRRLILLAFVVAELGMKGHAWWLIAKISDVVGGGGYWRAKLIDEFVLHFSEWWLHGSNYTAHWSPTGVGLPLYPDHMDLTNQFVAEGVNGGLLKLILFIVIIVACFKKAGRITNDGGVNREAQVVFWSMGCVIMAYITSFIAVANSAQNSSIFFAMIAALAVDPEKSNIAMEEMNAKEEEELIHKSGLSLGHAQRTSG